MYINLLPNVTIYANHSDSHNVGVIQNHVVKYGSGGIGGSGNSSSTFDVVNGFTGTYLTLLDDYAQSNAQIIYKYGTRAVSAAALTQANAARMLGIAKRAQILGNTLGMVTGAYTLYSAEMERRTTGKINYKGYADAVIGIAGGVAGTIVTFGLVSNPVGWGILATGAAIYGIGSFAYDAYNYQN